MDPIITNALTTAGEMTKSIALNLRTNNYTVRPDGIAPDDWYAMSLLAEALVYDAYGYGVIADRTLAHGYRLPKTITLAARARQSLRTQLTDALTNLSRDERIRLIDALADGLSTVAA